MTELYEFEEEEFTTQFNGQTMRRILIDQARAKSSQKRKGEHVSVTHAVEEPKREALADLGVPCFEIRIDPYRHESWTWEALRQDVLERPENRDWIFHPDLADLREQARCEATGMPATGHI